MIGGVLIHPNWNALVAAGKAVDFFGIPVRLFSYGSSILPIILTVWFMSYVERFAEKVSPNMVKAILKPLITMAVTSLVSLIILAPLGSYIGSILSSGIAFLDENVPVLVPTIVGAIQPLLVFFGMHLAIFPPLQTIQLAEMGYETVCGPGFLAAILACAGATLGFAVRSKDKGVKELGFSTGFTALCGVTEPAVYGIIVKYKQIIPAVVLGGVTGGLFAGIFHLKRYAIATPGIPALPTFMGEDPNNNGEGFDLKCKEGDEIKRGQLLLSFDPEAIRKAGHPDITVVAVTNSFDYTSVNVEKTGPAAAMDKVLTVTK